MSGLLSSVKLEGMEELMRKFERLSEASRSSKIRTALTKAAKPIKQQAQINAPVADKDVKRYAKGQSGKVAAIYKPGNLKKSIKIFRGKSRKWPNVHIGAAYSNKGKTVKNDGYYAHFVHDSHKTRGNATTKGNPFMKSAYESRKGEAMQIFEVELKAVLEKAFR
jgi:HK97 gp10 family phage protein